MRKVYVRQNVLIQDSKDSTQTKVLQLGFHYKAFPAPALVETSFGMLEACSSAQSGRETR